MPADDTRGWLRTIKKLYVKTGMRQGISRKIHYYIEGKSICGAITLDYTVRTQPYEQTRRRCGKCQMHLDKWPEKYVIPLINENS